jgi:cytochrome c-type biogenesis protein CcmH/NrfF
MSSCRRKFFQVLSVCILAVVMLGASGSDSSARYGRIGHNLMCVCGCGQVLLECNHVGCPDSSRMISELQDQLAGANGTGADSLVLNWFVAKYGATVLAAPIRGGFDVVAWILPLSLFVFGIFGTALVVRAWSQRRGAVAGAHNFQVQMPLDDAIREKIRRETEY